MNNKPVAWMTKKSLESLLIPFLSQVTLMTALKASKMDDFNIPLYTNPVKEPQPMQILEDGRIVPVFKDLTNEEIDKIESMCSVNEQGQINGREFANLILKKASEL